IAERKVDDMARGEHFTGKLQAIALVHPGIHLARVQAKRNGCVEAEGRILAIVIIRRSEEHTSELQSLMRISYAVLCLKKKKKKRTQTIAQQRTKDTNAN